VNAHAGAVTMIEMARTIILFDKQHLLKKEIRFMSVSPPYL
jgi:hypothetical protein